MLGSPKTDNKYHSGWGWAGSTPYRRETARLASGRHPQSAGDPLAAKSSRTLCRGINSCTSTTSSRPSTTSWASGPRSSSMVCPKTPIAGASFARTFTDPKAAGEEDSVFRNHGQPGHLSRRLDGLGVRSAGALAAGIAPRHPATGHPTTTAGSSITSTRTGPRPTTWPPRWPDKLADLKSCFPSSPPRTRAADRRWFVDSRLPPRTAHHTAIHMMGVPRRNHPYARILRARAR